MLFCVMLCVRLYFKVQGEWLPPYSAVPVFQMGAFPIATFSLNDVNAALESLSHWCTH